MGNRFFISNEGPSNSTQVKIQRMRPAITAEYEFWIRISLRMRPIWA